MCLDPKRALELLEEVVTEHGSETVYQKAITAWTNGTERCVYTVDDGSPSCLVGHVLVRAGITAERIDEMGINEGTSARNLYLHFDGIERDASKVLQAAQAVQDQGRPWGEALEAARFQYGVLTVEEE